VLFLPRTLPALEKLGSETDAGRRPASVGARSALTSSAIHILFPDYLAVIKDGKPLGELEHLNQAAQQMLDQLAWWTAALKAAREKSLRQAA
jgi:hypothetical protein